MFDAILLWLTNLVYDLGYLGIVIGMAIESTFIPLPSEVILIPAGMLWFQGKMNPLFIVLSSILGTCIGAYFTYFLGEKLGQSFFKKHHKYFFLNESRLDKINLFFNRFGSMSIFFGRLILGVRHYISFPAGFAKMNKTKFILYTALGSGIWSLILVVLGYFLGEKMYLIKSYVFQITLGILILILLIAIYYIFRFYFEFEGMKIKKRIRKKV